MSNRDSTRRLFRELTWTASSAQQHADRAAALLGQSLARWQVLEAFVDHPITVPAAARELRQSRQGTQRIVDLLTRENLLERNHNPGHQTSALYGVTSGGSDHLKAIESNATAWLDHVRHELTATELADLIRLLGRLRTIADEYQDDTPEA